MIIVNPGSGPVAESSEDLAAKNMLVFLDDLRKQFPSEGFHGDEECYGEEDGRFKFRVVRGGREFWVEMPGWPVEEVRYIGADDQNIWDFPRLYVDGSSWVWKFALNQFNPQYD